MTMILNEMIAGESMQPVREIAPLTHEEAGRLAQTEYERVLALLETLGGDDWQQPTYCDAWNVQQMTAHLAGAVTGWSSLGDLMHQTMRNPYLRQFAEPVDGINHLQVEERQAVAPADLIAEFRRNGQRAVDNRRRLPWMLRKIRLPMGSLGVAPLEYLTDTIYPRDQWMHRYDLCAATGKPMEVTAAHDGRIVALVMLDVARALRDAGPERTVALRLLGEAGGDYLFGRNAHPECTITLDQFDFNLRASGRISVDEVWPRLAFTGDELVVRWFLETCEVLY